MFVRRVKKDNGIVSVRIVEGQRKYSRVILKNIKIVGQSKRPEIIAILEETAKEIILSLQKTIPFFNQKRSPLQGSSRQCSIETCSQI